MNYILGLDVGIASIGWSVMESGENCEPIKIADFGCRIFTKAENPKTKESLALPRRLKRGARRLIKRKRQRMNEIKNLIIDSGIITKEQLEELYSDYNDESDSPWELRSKGLDKLLSNEEWVRVLIHIAKRRGFKSNKKIKIDSNSASDKEEGVLKDAVKKNNELLSEKGYRTVGEMFYKDDKFSEHKRNKGNYEFTVSRDMLISEIETLFSCQKQFGNKFTNDDLKNRFLEIFSRTEEQKDEIDKVGKCTFEKEERRAPKMCYTAERTILLQKINNLRIRNQNGDSYLSQKQREKVIDMLYGLNGCKAHKELKYSQIRKELNIPNEYEFVGLTISKKGKAKENTEDTKFIELKFWNSLKSHIKTISEDLWDEICCQPELMDDIGQALTYYKKESSIRENLSSKGVREEIISAVINLDFSKVGNLSLKAMKKIMPFLEQGNIYSKACELAGYNHSDIYGKEKKQKKLPKIPEDGPNNPVVRRALAQSRKVINAIINKYGSPLKIHIELARDMGKSIEDRNRIEKEQKENMELNNNTRNAFFELVKREPKKDELLKYKLHGEQHGICAYCQTPLDIKRTLTEEGYTQIDHVIPFSRSLDDSYMNKVLVCTACNQNKGNNIPFEFFGGDEKKWNAFEIWSKATYKEKLHRKGQNLLRKKFDEEDEQNFKSRNLNDTRYISKYLASFINDNLEFAPSDIKVKLLCVKGQVTAQLRKRWGLTKDRDKDDKHHAMDATVIACATPTLIKRITDFSQSQEGKYIKNRKEIIEDENILDLTSADERFPKPYEGFRKELIARLSNNPSEKLKEYNLKNYESVNLDEINPIFVSRMPNRKVTGPAHADTIRSKKRVETEGISVVRKQIDVNLKLETIEKMVDKKAGAKWLYEGLKKRLAEFGGESKKAFAGKVYIDKGGKACLVRSIKIAETSKSGIEVNNGIADNGSMVRVDVFTEKEVKKGKKKKYYLVPIYVADIANGITPNKAILANESYEDWTVMDNNFEFLFSLYSNDLFRYKIKDKVIFGYYLSTDRATGSITYDLIDGSKKGERTGVKTVDLFEKYVVDVLGNYHKVKGEKRSGI